MSHGEDPEFAVPPQITVTSGNQEAPLAALFRSNATDGRASPDHAMMDRYARQTHIGPKVPANTITEVERTAPYPVGSPRELECSEENYSQRNRSATISRPAIGESENNPWHSWNNAADASGTLNIRRNRLKSPNPTKSLNPDFSKSANRDPAARDNVPDGFARMRTSAAVADPAADSTSEVNGLQASHVGPTSIDDAANTSGQQSPIVGELWLDAISLRDWFHTYLTDEIGRSTRTTNRAEIMFGYL